MATIQEVGTQILTKNPQKFYAFCGKEYGVKLKYLKMIEDVHGQVINAESVASVLSTMRTKRIVPLPPALYVVRYDEDFISKLSDKTAKELAQTKIVGTIVCMYEQDKHYTKLMKHLPDCTVSIDTINEQFVHKYLKSDFPDLPDNVIQIAVKWSPDYNSARIVCYGLSQLPLNHLCKLSEADILQLIGCNNVSTDLQIRMGVASRNFEYLIDAVSDYEGEPDSILYTMLSTMLELDKVLDGKNSDLRDYRKLWTREDVYYMFMHTYRELKRLRSASVSDPTNVVVYLASLLRFPRIPALEVLQ